MKHALTFLSILFIIASSFAQGSQKMSYQAAIKNTSGVMISNTEIGIQVTILHESPDGPEIYREEHQAVTGSEGLATLSIGKGINPQGDFSSIDWADGPYFVKTAIDPRGGSNFTVNGSCELFAPYLSKAEHSGMASQINSAEVRNIQGIQETNISSNSLASRMDNVLCDLNTYQSATLIAPSAFPYTSPGSGLTVSVATNTGLLNNTTYSCGPNSFPVSPNAWWIFDAGHFITLTFSQPVTNFSVVVNGTNLNEVFKFNTATGSINLTNYCQSGFAIGGNASELSCSVSGPTGTLITVNNPAGSTQYTIMHNGFAAGSRISLLDCFASGPYVDPVSNIDVCAGTTIPGVDFTGTEDATFNWTNDNPGIGLASSGTGDIPAFPAIGSSTTQVANISVTASLAGDTSAITNFSITVNPTPNVNAVASQEICADSGTAPVNFSGLVPGTVYNWTNNTPSIGLAASGSGDIPAFTAINSGTSPVTATIIVTPTFTAGQSTCDGSPVSFTIKVNPTLTVDTVSNQTVCNNGSTASVAFTGSVPGTTFNWTNNTPSIGLAASGSGDIPSFTALNAGTASVTANITVSANGSNSRVYIPNKDSDNVSVIDLATNTVITTINVGDSPFSACVIPDGSRVYVVNSNSNSISIINTSTNTVTGTIPVSASPFGINSSPDGSRLYVTRPGANALSVINTATNTEVASIAVGSGPYCPAVSPDGSRVYVTNQFSSTVSVINTSNNTLLTTIPTGTNLSGACVSPDGSKVYVTGVSANSVSVINTATNAVESVISGVSNPLDICVSPDGSRAYVSSRNVNMITVINTVTNTIIATIPGFNFPNGLKLNLDGSLLYVANTNSNNIKIVNTATNTIIGTVSVGAGPWGLYGNFVQSSPENCSGTPQTFTITVDPSPVGSASPQTICSGSASSVNLNSTIPGTTFTWTASIQTTPSGGTITGFSSCGSACGTSINQTLTNTGTSNGVVRYLVTPIFDGCSGTPFTVDVTVNICCPTIPTVTTSPTPAICEGNNVTISASGLTTMNPNSYGITFKYYSAPVADPYTGGTVIATVPNGSLTGGGTGAATATNTLPAGNLVIYAILSPTPTDPACRPSATVNLTVNPTPTVIATPSTQTICSASSITTIVLSGAVGGTTYNWTRDNTATVTGIAASGSGNISGTLTNSTSAPVTVTFTITPTANGCAGAPITAIVLVNPTPNAIATPSAQTICSASSITTIVLNGAVGSTTYNWTRDNTATVTGIAASGSGNISGTLTNITSAPVTVTFTVTPTANGCAGAPITATVLVNPTPNAIATPSTQTICSASSITTIVLSGAVGGTTYNWTRDNTATVSGIAASGSGNISGTLTNSTSAPVLVTFTVTSTANGCAGAPITATVLVNPTPNAIATPSAQTICSASSITTIVLSGAVVSTTYNWTRDNTATVSGIAASGSGNISGTLTNSTSAPVTVTITITPTANGCAGAPITATVLVNPTPNAIATPSTQTICSASSITTIVLNGAVGSTTYNWTRDNTATVTGIAASGSGNISGTLTNTTNAPVLVTFTVTPSANGCTGPTTTATVLVNPLPTYIFTSNGLPYSEGDTITACHQDVLALTITSPTSLTYSFKRLSNGNVISSGTTPAAFNYTATNAREGYYEISVTNALGCNLKDTIYLLVNALPNPTATATPNPICQGGNLQLGVNGNNNFGFAWSGPNGFTSNVKNPLISGITPAGTGTYVVTVTNLNGCSDTSSINVLVNPTPTAIATPASQTICSAGTITTIVLTGAVSGTIYNWTRNNTATVTGIAASGSGNISGTLTNTTSAPVTVTFTITPTANGCTGLPITATVLVNPTPNAVATPASQTICSATAITTIALTGSVTGTTYTWTRDNTATVTGIAASGSGNISGTLTNTTNAPVLVTFTVTPTANGCTGAAITATVLINPTSNVIATPASQAICSGTSITTIVLSGAVSGTTYNWTRNNTATVTGIAASGSGNISGAMINNTSAPVTVTFTITPSANGCAGTPVTATVVVNPLPAGTISIAPNPACVGSTVQLSATGGVLYAWSGPQGFVSTAQNPTILLTSHLQQGKYIVTITSSAGCSVIKFAELTVFYPPVATATYETSTACTGSTLILHGTGAGSYSWTGPAGFISSKPDPEIPSVTAANSGLYTLIVTSPNGCSATTTVNVTINNPPALSANPTLTQTCEGSSIQLFATGSGDFVWHGPATYTSTQQNPVIDNIPIHLSGTYTVELTASTGCVSTASVAVKVYDQIHAFASASADTICEGQSLQLHAEGGSTYLWNGPAGFFSTESDPRIDNITLKHSGKYYVYMSNEGGCFGYAELSVFVKPAAKGSAYATPNPVIENNPVQFFASSTGVAYAWSGPLGFTSSEQNPSIKKVTRYMAGIYTVTITNENDCPTVVKVNLRVLFTNKGGQTITGDGEEELTTRSEVAGTIYPNPTNDILYFDTKGSEAIEYVIYDVNGRVQMQKMTTVDNYISTNKLSSGVYQIRWRHEGSKEWNVNRFVKIR